jgi:hypothetical protein
VVQWIFPRDAGVCTDDYSRKKALRDSWRPNEITENNSGKYRRSIKLMYNLFNDNVTT